MKKYYKAKEKSQSHKKTKKKNEFKESWLDFPFQLIL